MANGALGAMTGIIPVVFVGGAMMKMTEYMMPHDRRGTSVRRQPKRSARQPRRRSRLTSFGDFSNAGF